MCVIINILRLTSSSFINNFSEFTVQKWKTYFMNAIFCGWYCSYFNYVFNTIWSVYMNATSWAGTVYAFAAYWFSPDFQCRSRCSIFSSLCTVLSLIVGLFTGILLVIILSDCHRSVSSNCPCGIFNLLFNCDISQIVLIRKCSIRLNNISEHMFGYKPERISYFDESYRILQYNLNVHQKHHYNQKKSLSYSCSSCLTPNKVYKWNILEDKNLHSAIMDITIESPVSELCIKISGCLIRSRIWWSFASIVVHHRFLVESVLLIFQFSVLCCVFVFCLSPSCFLCVQCWKCLWTVNSCLPRWFYVTLCHL